VTPPTEADLAPLLPLLRNALEAISSGGGLVPVNRLLAKYPPDVHLSTHDGTAHLHHARDGEAGLTWLGRSCAAGLAHAACGAPEVTVGKCAAADCGQFFVDQSRNRSRRFCGNTCASRTTVAAYRARQKG
jgi:predicted RNA-binding Zn ribbon-like protein